MLRFSAATFFIGMATGYIYFDDPMAGLVIFLCLYGVYPAYKNNEERKLKQLMMVQFKDLLYSVSASLSLGRNMRQALEESLSFWGNTYDEKDPIMIEVRNMLREMKETNAPDIKVLRDFADRWEISDITDFVNVYESLRITGGDMPGAVSRAASVIGDKITMEKELNAAMSEKLAEGRIVGAAPFVMTAAMKFLSPAYMSPVYETGLGTVVALTSLALSVAAILMIERINRIDF